MIGSNDNPSLRLEVLKTELNKFISPSFSTEKIELQSCDYWLLWGNLCAQLLILVCEGCETNIKRNRFPDNLLNQLNYASASNGKFHNARKRAYN